jgi:hypothetical protein
MPVLVRAIVTKMHVNTALRRKAGIEIVSITAVLFLLFIADISPCLSIAENCFWQRESAQTQAM